MIMVLDVLYPNKDKNAFLFVLLEPFSLSHAYIFVLDACSWRYQTRFLFTPEKPIFLFEMSFSGVKKEPTLILLTIVLFEPRHTSSLASDKAPILPLLILGALSEASEEV